MSDPTNDSNGVTKRELASSVLLKEVDLEPFLELLQGGELRSLEEGEVLMEVRESNRTLYLILSGRLTIQLQPELNPIAVLGPGDVVGELSFIDGQLTTAYAVAGVSTRVLALDEEIMTSLLETSPDIARNLLFVLARRVRHLTNQELRREHANYAVRQYAQDVIIDSLTGLYNRRWLDSMLVRELNRSDRDGRPLSLLLIGIDDFKQQTENEGRLAGESVLNAIAAVLQATTRPGEMLARYGKDEFMTVLPDTDTATGQEIGERLRQAIHQAQVPTSEGDSPAPLTVSIGVAERIAGDQAEALISAVDGALYDAREAGGNQVCQVSRSSNGNSSKGKS
ncbi:MAG: GGDEF domain-containing protein [Acidobacteria bacterium]|nr:MAG: GGDEF domain-containing protein [Acidobacteriota bacterium]